MSLVEFKVQKQIIIKVWVITKSNAQEAKLLLTVKLQFGLPELWFKAQGSKK